jgi:hypothetical protein
MNPTISMYEIVIFIYKNQSLVGDYTSIMQLGLRQVISENLHLVISNTIPEFSTFGITYGALACVIMNLPFTVKTLVYTLTSFIRRVFILIRAVLLTFRFINIDSSIVSF